MMKMNRLLTAAVCLFLSMGIHAQTVIHLEKESEGKYMVDAKLNGVGVVTYYTEESWYASVSSTTYLFLYENGYIANADVKGMTVVKMPNGKTTKAGSFVIRSLRIGNVIVKDLPAFVVAKQTVPLLIGSSTFDCFGEVTIDGDRLIINDADEVVVAATEETLSPSDQLKIRIQELMEAEDYEKVAEAMAELRKVEPLTMYQEYQYIVVQNILGHSDETISTAERWLEDNAGKSATLDYWVYDCLGDSYARKKLTSKSIAMYEKAVQSYCRMFNTTEKEIKKSAARDETLGVTLFDLGRQYASAGDHKKAVDRCKLAAKCGNKGAVEFCEKFKIRF